MDTVISRSFIMLLICTQQICARLLLDLEKPPAYSSGLLFENTGSTPLYEAVLDGKDVCLHSLPEPPVNPC
jgi:hypothetical protein